MKTPQKKYPVARTENLPVYGPLNRDTASDDALIAQALQVLESRLRKPGETMTDISHVKHFAVLHYAPLEQEVFGGFFLNAQYELIEHVQLFYGTLSQTSVYPREVVKRALALNAGAVIFVHNHPSGTPEPSRADEQLTSVLKHALTLVDVRVLDHIIVGNMKTVSFAERGLL